MTSLLRKPSTFPPLSPDTWVLTGATASGKSSVATEIAERLGGEIISLDSIAVYRGMDVGTAKPSRADRERIPHHLIDVVDPTDEFSVAQYLELALEKADEIRRRSRVPIFVGGTPLYLKGLVSGLDPGPPADWDFRRAVERDVEAHGSDALWKRVWQVDPLSASRLAATDTRRLIRVLEVVRATGLPLSHRQSQFAASGGRSSHPRWFVLRWPRPILHERIERRVPQMFASGLIDEVRGLLNRHGALSRTAAAAVGYREVIEHLAGRLTLEETTAQVTAHTRKLARKQETWFRSLPELTPIEMGSEIEDPAALAERLIASANSALR